VKLIVIILFHLAIDAEVEDDVVRVWDRGFWDYSGNGAECVEAFCDGPWKPLFLCFVLDVPRGEVDSEDVACL